MGEGELAGPSSSSCSRPHFPTAHPPPKPPHPSCSHRPPAPHPLPLAHLGSEQMPGPQAATLLSRSGEVAYHYHLASIADPSLPPPPLQKQAPSRSPALTPSPSSALPAKDITTTTLLAVAQPSPHFLSPYSYSNTALLQSPAIANPSLRPLSLSKQAPSRSSAPKPWPSSAGPATDSALSRPPPAPSSSCLAALPSTSRSPHAGLS